MYYLWVSRKGLSTKKVDCN